jgi:dihydroorotate dehydrogenase
VQIRRLLLSIARRILWWIGSPEPERAHHVVITGLEWASARPPLLAMIGTLTGQKTPGDGPFREIMGMRFHSPVGLASGFDKEGRCLPALERFGFGFIEAGGVTVRAQEGNPQPRLQRFPTVGALINGMGFPNQGVDAIAERLAHAQRLSIPVGWNLAKGRDTPPDDAGNDFIGVMHGLWPYADFFSVNVSSPNTPGLRQLEQAHELARLLPPIIKSRDDRATYDGRRAVLIKISPDLSDEQVDEVVDVASAVGVDGIIATNTTLRRDGLPPGTHIKGGMSGTPLHRRSVEVVARIAARADGPAVIGVGGIMSAPDAARMLAAGASLVQICTGLIFHGPELVEDINRQVTPDWLRAAVTKAPRVAVAATH